MTLLKTLFFIAILLLVQPVLLLAQHHQLVDPMIGSEGDGNVFTGPSCPFGMVKPGPDCSVNSNNGYSPDRSKPVYGFSQVHVSGTGGGPKYGNVSVMPFSGDLESIKQESLRGDEKAALGFYSVLLQKWNIRTEITTSPSPNLYLWIGRPDLSSDRIHQIIDKNFTSRHNGIPGNDDSGAMSSWLAFHMMGLYPNAGQSYYLINTPYFKQTVIHQENGTDFTITANNLSDNNKYIKSATLNGKPFTKAWIEHQDIANGGNLVFEMDAAPSGSWGTTIIPPSKSDNKSEN